MPNRRMSADGMYMKLKEFEMAYEKAMEVNLKLNRPEHTFVPLSDIFETIKLISGYKKIDIYFVNYNDFDDSTKKKIDKNAGAMLSTEKDANGKRAIMVINSSKSPQMQRFAMVHELGHLITSVPNYKYETTNDGKLTISTQINSDITNISYEDCEKSDYNKAEQIANIFAILVLIPDNITIKDLSIIGIEALANKYGVTIEAVYSRLILSTKLSVEKENLKQE